MVEGFDVAGVVAVWGGSGGYGGRDSGRRGIDAPAGQLVRRQPNVAGAFKIRLNVDRGCGADPVFWGSEGVDFGNLGAMYKERGV